MKKIFFFGLSVILICLNFKGICQTSTFAYTGGVQTYTVGAGVTTIAVDVRGAIGGGVNCAHTSYQSLGGCGGRVQATLNVTPGHVLNVIVGQLGSNAGAAAYGGGGDDLALYSTTWPGAGGGGGTTITDVTAGTT